MEENSKKEPLFQRRPIKVKAYSEDLKSFEYIDLFIGLRYGPFLVGRLLNTSEREALTDICWDGDCVYDVDKDVYFYLKVSKNEPRKWVPLVMEEDEEDIEEVIDGEQR
jgi:hypothetical protein